jgi:hypothetical protein
LVLNQKLRPETFFATLGRFEQMCNLYSISTNQAAIAALFQVINQYVGNLHPMPGVYPAPWCVMTIRCAKW